MPIAHTIIGDLNACGGSKKRRLEEFIETEQLDDIGREDHTHVWGSHRCRIDRVLTRRTGKPWVFKEGWECDSDHTIVATKVMAEAAIVERIEKDWNQVREWLAGKAESSEEPTEWQLVGQRTKGTQQVVDENSENLWQKEKEVADGMETTKNNGGEVQGGEEGVSRRSASPKGRRKVGMGHSESAEEPLQPKDKVH